MKTPMDQARFQHYCHEQHFTAQTQDRELVVYPPHTPLRITHANKGPLWIRQGTAWIKR